MYTPPLFSYLYDIAHANHRDKKKDFRFLSGPFF